MASSHRLKRAKTYSWKGLDAKVRRESQENKIEKGVKASPGAIYTPLVFAIKFVNIQVKRSQGRD